MQIIIRNILISQRAQLWVNYKLLLLIFLLLLEFVILKYFLSVPGPF